eukprot:scaffold85640_cov19-Tisochrysis_lutea.AAC.2
MRHEVYSSKADVWSWGVLLVEALTLQVGAHVHFGNVCACRAVVVYKRCRCVELTHRVWRWGLLLVDALTHQAGAAGDLKMYASLGSGWAHVSKSAMCIFTLMANSVRSEVHLGDVGMCASVGTRWT